MPSEHRRSLTFQLLMDRIRQGDHAAMGELVLAYGPYLMYVIRKDMSSRLRSQNDSLDFYQKVFASFFLEPARIPYLATCKDLMNYLRGIARNKLNMEKRKQFYTAKYDLSREISLDQAAPDADSNDPGTPHHVDLIDRRVPSPSFMAGANEEWQLHVAKLSCLHQGIVELRAHGATFEEIATKLGCCEKTARRVMEKLENKFLPPREQKPDAD